MTPTRVGIVIVLALAAFKLSLHLATTGLFGYGHFVDELYYLALSEHLDWGYVDVPPLFPLVTAGVRTLFGDSLFAVRLVPTLAGASLVLVTGLLARDLGGGRFAMTVSALAVVTAPVYLGLHSLHTMNALDPLFWTATAWVLLRILRGGDPRLWLVFGLVSGLGLLNKHAMAFWGLALVVGLLLTPERRVFRERWVWLGGLVALAVVLPNVIWNVVHGFPHLEVLAMIRLHGRDAVLSPIEFVAQQVLMLHPLALPIWLAGLLQLLRGESGRLRVLGVAYLALIAEMLLLDGRFYYPAPAYPILFAAGGFALEGWLQRRRVPRLRPVYVGLLVVTAAFLAPAWLPCLPPATFVRYAEFTGLTQVPVENHELGPLPQLHADRFGWREMAEEVARVYHALPAAERGRTAILAPGYGQAGAIDLFGPKLGLPKAISGHLTYHYWGPRGYTGDVAIVVGGEAKTLAGFFEGVEPAGRTDHPWAMPRSRLEIFICRRMREPLRELWPRLRNWA